jgi:hypothetical protein
MNLKYIVMAGLAATNLAQADLLSTSLVRTPLGECYASTLKKGAVLLALDRNKAKLVPTKVTNVEKATTNTMYSIDTEEGTINAVPGQTLYDTQRKKWVHAHEVTPGSSLIDCQKRPAKVLKVNEKTGQFETVRISVEDPHVMLADGLLTHNFGVTLITGSAAYIASAIAAAQTAAAATAATATVVSATTTSAVLVTTAAASTATTAVAAGGLTATITAFAVAHPIVAGGATMVAGGLGQGLISEFTHDAVHWARETCAEQWKNLYRGKKSEDQTWNDKYQ